MVEVEQAVTSTTSKWIGLLNGRIPYLRFSSSFIKPESGLDINELGNEGQLGNTKFQFEPPLQRIGNTGLYKMPDTLTIKVNKPVDTGDIFGRVIAKKNAHDAGLTVRVMPESPSTFMLESCSGSETMSLAGRQPKQVTNIRDMFDV